MADWYDSVIKMRAKKLINQAQQQGLGFVDFMREAASKGVSEDGDVQNYARILREDQLRQRSSGRQKAITGAVGRAMQPVPAAPESQLQSMRTSLSPENYANQLSQNPEMLRNVPAPQTEEQFSGALGRQQLPEDTTMEDVKSNPQYQFALGALGNTEEELSKARLKLQQDELARKQKQIDEKNRLGNLRLKLQDRDLQWKYYNAGVNAMKPEFENADDWDKMAEEASKDFGTAESHLNRWKTIAKEIDKEGSEYFGQYTPEEVNAKIAETETLMRQAKVQREEWAKRATEIRKGAYERGSNISKGSKKTFVEPKPAAPQPTPSAGNVAKSFRSEFNY
jgi:hypothetical protein